ncbi:oxidoreductase [Pedobacter punctiformis]|uniref:Oxidoreductase n=1 Tax=Pedobacter punctiformis TaxID=3004097 RepID=A0ABT4L880_9SPHI|nr:oxidoreductase [Pedobacter sp. HCMS5-2]MCZ4244115.1 oxidoreductase [Pedobacter sp. HCMS5-2]
MKTQQKVWLVTGVSGGLGKELAKSIYLSGDIIIGTMRSEKDKMLFEQDFPQRSKAFILDLSDTGKIPVVVEESVKIFGKIDVLVNNAGYGLFGMVEEASEEEVRHQLEVNFLAVWKLTQAVLPIMRQQKSGHIIQLSSRVGISAGVGGGLYAAGKFAIEGLSEALAQEVSAFGIKVTLVEPGPLRTDFFGRSVVFAQKEITDYHAATGNIRERSKQMDGKQPGDPAKVASSILEISRLENPPFRLPFTQATLDTLQQKIISYQQVIDDWKEIAVQVQY